MFSMSERTTSNALEEAVARVGDRWTLLLVSALLDGPRRFNDLIDDVGGIAPNVLSQRLRQLEQHGILVATPYSTRPPRFVYQLTGSGLELAGVLRLLAQWGAGQGPSGAGPVPAAAAASRCATRPAAPRWRPAGTAPPAPRWSTTTRPVTTWSVSCKKGEGEERGGHEHPGTGSVEEGLLAGRGHHRGGGLGAIVWFAVGFIRFSDRIDDFQRVPTNGQGEVTFDEAGGYVIHFEGPGASDGEIPSGQAQLTPVGGGEPVPLETYESDFTYDLNGRAGVAVLTVDIVEPGTYLLESESEGEGELAVGRSVAGTLVTGIVGGLALGGFGLVVGVIVLIVTAVRRRGARPKNAPWIPPPPGSQPPPPPPPPPYGSPPPPPPPSSGSPDAPSWSRRRSSDLGGADRRHRSLRRASGTSPPSRRPAVPPVDEAGGVVANGRRTGVRRPSDRLDGSSRRTRPTSQGLPRTWPGR